MEEKYDVIVLGTGLKESILSGLLSVDGKTVLHMDRNSYYGAESASLNLDQLFQKFSDLEEAPKEFGRARNYNVDLCPKFLMACGNLVKMLLHTKVTRYLDFKSIAGSYVVKEGKVRKVPSTPAEALSSPLMGMFQKRRFKNFLNYVNAHEQEDQSTWEKKDASKATSREIFNYWKLDENTISFVGHALALYQDDSYLDRPALECIDRIKLYAYSTARYGNSPYIYPVWGLGGLPEGFSRLSAIHGGVYMLNKPIEEILYDEDGKVKGVKSEGQVAYCDKLLADPTYFIGTDKVKKVGQVAKCICILSHPIPNTHDNDSCQIIVPFKQLPGKTHDIYISSLSYHHQVAHEGKWLATVSTVVETNDPHTELIPGLRLLGQIDREFMFVTDSYAPTNGDVEDNVFISNSYDSTSHFEAATREVMGLYEKITGAPVDLTANTDPENLQE